MSLRVIKGACFQPRETNVAWTSGRASHYRFETFRKKTKYLRVFCEFVRTNFLCQVVPIHQPSGWTSGVFQALFRHHPTLFPPQPPLKVSRRPGEILLKGFCKDLGTSPQIHLGSCFFFGAFLRWNMEHPKSLNLLVSTVCRALICPKRCKRMEISTSAFRGARRIHKHMANSDAFAAPPRIKKTSKLWVDAIRSLPNWTTQNVTGFKPPSFFPFRSSDVGNRKDVSHVVESLFCLSLVTESGERSMGSNLVTESGTPRTITCPKVESIQF